MADPVQIAWDAKMSNIDWERAQTVNQQQIDEYYKRYNQQRVDALNDFNMTNAYNHPTQQMNRLRQAGVNPHLAFGKGGESTASMIRSSQGNDPNLKQPLMNKAAPGNNNILEFANVQQMQAQTDQTKQVTQNLRIDQLLKTLETAGKSTSNANALVDYQVKKRTADAAVRKLQAEMGISENAETKGYYENQYWHTQDANSAPGSSNYTRTQDLMKDNFLQDNQIKKQILQTGDISNKMRLTEQLFKQNGLDNSDPYALKAAAKAIIYSMNEEDIEKALQTLKNQRK